MITLLSNPLLVNGHFTGETITSYSNAITALSAGVFNIDYTTTAIPFSAVVYTPQWAYATYESTVEVDPTDKLYLYASERYGSGGITVSFYTTLT